MKVTVINTIAPRVFSSCERRVTLPPLAEQPSRDDHDYLERYAIWMRKNWWWVDYSVHVSQKAKAKALSLELDGLLRNQPDSVRIPAVIVELQAMRMKEHNAMTHREKWDRTALSLPDDIGGGHDVRKIITAFLSSRYHGTVLEAMCGFNSYLLAHTERNVVALDYSREMLERYPFPYRLRIQCDLNNLESGATIPCFDSGKFDAIIVCFGYRYPRRLAPVLAEFKRILKPQGTLAFVENPTHGYSERCRRAFIPDLCVKTLKSAGFSPTCERIPIETFECKESCYFHIAGKLFS